MIIDKLPFDVPSDPLVVFGPTLVPVSFDAGSLLADPGTACSESGGEEICQWAVAFETTGNLKIIDVIWARTSVVEDDEPVDPATLRRGTGGNALSGELSNQQTLEDEYGAPLLAAYEKSDKPIDLFKIKSKDKGKPEHEARLAAYGALVVTQQRAGLYSMPCAAAVLA